MEESSHHDRERSRHLHELERKALWLACWTIHHANHIRANRDGLKVGGHQASCASSSAILSALYFNFLLPTDRVAVKPHASPVFHAIQYLYGRQSRDRLENFRALGGAQSYPSRTKDVDGVDFSTGSEGLGIAMTAFSAMVQDYVAARGAVTRPGRMIAVAGDAELDEGNVYECLLEGAKHQLRNTWWIVDYNRQSLDSVTADRASEAMRATFEAVGWKVHLLKYGARLRAAFEQPGGGALHDWIDRLTNAQYAALVYEGGAAWRKALKRDLADATGILGLLEDHDDPSLAALLTDLGGHDLDGLLDAFRHAEDDETPQCFIAYTIKGHRLPFAGHKDNHSGLMTVEQIERFRDEMKVRAGHEWDRFEGLASSAEELDGFLASTPYAEGPGERYQAPRIDLPDRLPTPRGESASTQEGFGRLLAGIARGDSELADRIVTTSPDVTVSTNLGAWVNRRGLFHPVERPDPLREHEIHSSQEWSMSPQGQHLELGIAENNLFVALAALGLSHSLFGHRLLPIGTVYDPFVARGLDALNYACYQDARFLLVATPSGLTLAPEGGAHQSIGAPLLGMGQPGLTTYEPAFNDELAVLIHHAFEQMQEEDGGSTYLRLSTLRLRQPQRELTEELRDQIEKGAYWWTTPNEQTQVALVATGVLVDQARRALEAMREDDPHAALLVVTSADKLHSDWTEAQRSSRARGGGKSSHVQEMLGLLPPDAALVTAIDGHPATLSWIGSVARHRTICLGTEKFGQSGDVQELYREYGLDADSMLDAVAQSALERVGCGS